MSPRPRMFRFLMAFALVLATTAALAWAIPATGTPIAQVAPPSDSWVVAENELPGTPSWRIPSYAKRHISGFASSVSAVPGASVDLYVDTTAASFRVKAYRMGYYQGLGARFIWVSPKIAGRDQPAAATTPVTNMVETSWSPSTRMAIGRDWPEGTYLLKLMSSAGGRAYIPLIVRNDESRAALMIQHQVTTWQAYNKWGGSSLYAGADGSFATRSRVVSFDRPYAGRGAGGLLTSLPFVALAESQGLDVTYSTDVDLHVRPQLVTDHRALISLDHDEYWSTAMRNAATAARDAGVNLAFLGANAIYRHIRLEPSPVGPHRRQVSYKRADEDPMHGVDNSEVTVSWREPPLRDPESELLGAMYECNPVHADMVVADAGAWVFEGTGLAEGDLLTGAVDMEYDRIFPNAPTPWSIQVLAQSPLTCKGQPRVADMTYYTTRARAGVFDLGSQGWVKKIRCLEPFVADTCDLRAQRITVNVLRAFAAGPAGELHPSVPNAASFGYVLAQPTDP